MNRTLELQQRKAALCDAAEAIRSKAVTEKRGLTAEELTDIDAKINEAEGIDKTIRAEARLAALSAAKDGGHIEPSYGLAPNLDAHFRANGFKPFGPEKRSDETKLEREYRLFRGFGEQLQAVRAAALSPHDVDPRLTAMNDWYQRAAAPAGASEQVPADGGFLVYPDFATEVLRIAHDTGLVYTMGRKIPLSPQTNAIKLPAVDEQSRKDGYRWGGVRAYWMNEADALTGSRPKFRLLELVTKKLGALYYATDELVADAVALGAIVTQAFGEEFGFKMDDAAINGDGAGKPQGILNSPALITILKESSPAQSATTFIFENAVKMWYRLWARSRKNAFWFVNQDVEQQLLQMYKLVGSAGGSSVVAGVAPYQGPWQFYTPQGFMGNETAMLFGRPIVPIEQAQTLGTKGDVILADMSQWVYIDKGEPQQAVSMHVRFLTDEMTYRSIYRVDGQGWWHTPLTPFNGTTTVSPFVCCETRQ